MKLQSCVISAVVAAAAALAVHTGEAAEVSFTVKPWAERVGDKVKITFAVSAPTDVDAAILDGQGGVVRHLAAGVLGENAPAPFKKASLTQELVWDGKDDDGHRVLGAGVIDASSLRVRVRAGLKVTSAGTAFAEYTGADTLREVMGLAVGPGGRVYVLSRRWQRGWWTATTVHVFRRDGSYEKTIKPFPSGLPPERVSAITSLREHGRPLPTIYRVVAMSFYPYEDVAQQPAVTADGSLHLLVVPAAYRKEPLKRLATIDADGGIPYGAYAGAVLAEKTAPGQVHLAPSSDGKAVYIAGLERLPGEEVRPNVPAVHKVPLPQRSPAQVFMGEPEETGSDESHLNDPRGLATDGKGHLFVADRGNNRIVVVRETDARVMGTFSVPTPGWVGVHHKTGAVYVESEDNVVKFGGWRNPKQVSRLRLPPLAERDRQRTRWSFALDYEAEPAVLWLGRDRGEDWLMRSVDEGETWSEPERAGCQPARTFWNIAVGQDRRTVACKVGWNVLRILDEETGATRDLQLTGSPGQTYRLGPNGQIYGMDHWRYGIRRWDKEGKPLPFPASIDHPELEGRLFNVPSGTTSWERDFCVDRAGNVYTKHRGKQYHGRMRVDEYDRDGNFKRTVIWVVSDGALGPRVDGQGNVYIAECIKPPGSPYPAFFKDKLPDVKIDWKGDVAYTYRWMYGSMVKFSPKGGAVWFPIRRDVDVYAFDGEPQIAPSLAKEPFEFVEGDRMRIDSGELQGALWWRYGCSYLLDMHPGHNRRCHCTASEFDVDDYGRVFYPDQGRFCVVVLDPHGNEITRFGRYGNQDDAQEGTAIAWTVGLGVSDRYVYVADAFNRQVLRCALEYTREEIRAVRAR